MKQTLLPRAKGLLEPTAYGEHFYDDFTAKRKENIAKQDKINDTFLGNVKKFGGDKEKAMSETFTAADCLSGATDNDY